MIINCKKDDHTYGNIGYRVYMAYYKSIYRDDGVLTYIGIWCNNILYYYYDSVSRWYIYVD